MPKYSLKENFIIKESLEEQIELTGNVLTVYHLTDTEKLGQAILPKSNIKPTAPKKTGNRARDISNKIEYNKRLDKLDPTDQEKEYQGILSILGDPYTVGTGFKPGSGDMYGPGLYTCFKFNPSISKVYGDICLKFKFDISNTIIFFEDLAKKIHGDKWRVFDQLENILINKTNANPDNIANTISSIKSVLPKKLKRSSISNNSFYDDESVTSEFALGFSRQITMLNLSNFVDGIIFRGDHDGPVCVIYNPSRDAELIGLGRLVKDKVNWEHSLAEFFGNRVYSGISFQDMNDIAKENHNDVLPEINLDEINKRVEITKTIINRKTPTEVLTQIFYKLSDDNAKIMIVNHPNVDPDLLYDIAKSLSKVKNNLYLTILNKTSFPSKKVVQEILRGGDIESIDENFIELILKSVKYHTTKLIDILSHHSSEVIRRYCATSPKASVSTLIRLSQDDNFVVRESALSNKNLPFDYLEDIKLSANTSLPVKGRIASETKDIEKLKILCKDEHRHVKLNSVLNPIATEEIFANLMSDPDISVRAEVAGRTTDPIKLNILSKDPYVVVSSKATSNIHYLPNVQSESILKKYIKIILS